MDQADLDEIKEAFPPITTGGCLMCGTDPHALGCLRRALEVAEIKVEQLMEENARLHQTK